MKLTEEIKTAEEIANLKKERQAQYYKAFKKKNPDYYKANDKKYRTEYFEKSLFKQTKAFAKKNKIKFTLDLNDVVIPEICPLTQIAITKSVGKGRVVSNPCIYRKIEALGYIKENIIITCRLANQLRAIDPKVIVAYAKIIIKSLD